MRSVLWILSCGALMVASINARPQAESEANPAVTQPEADDFNAELGRLLQELGDRQDQGERPDQFPIKMSDLLPFWVARSRFQRRDDKDDLSAQLFPIKMSLLKQLQAALFPIKMDF